MKKNEHYVKTTTGGTAAKASKRRVEAELLDSFDEEFELELDDHRLGGLMDGMAERPDINSPERQFYFKELF
jgi:hypothetical protein